MLAYHFPSAKKIFLLGVIPFKGSIFDHELGQVIKWQSNGRDQ